jgi:sugar phosphate isomerase/epimerase
MAHTHTGSFPIGYRSTSSPWREDLDKTLAFARESGFDAIDVRVEDALAIKKVTDAGLRIGSVDLPQPWTDLAGADDGRRHAAAQRAIEFVRTAAGVGATVFFVAVMVEDPTAKRSVNLDRAADGYGRLCEAIKDLGVSIVIEGWPGPDPYAANLACTPEGYRAVFDAIGSDVMAVNYDPSHLVRMGIDPIRFLSEFAPRVRHVHAKDTMIVAEDMYQYGNLQPATLAKPYVYGGYAWRYTLPGHGVTPWINVMRILEANQYRGVISIELEDANFFGTEPLEKHGFIAARDFLVHV